MDSGHFIEHFLTAKTIATVILVALVMGVRYGLVRYIRRAPRDWTSQQRLRWIGTSRIFFTVVALLGVIYLWGEAIQGFAVSVFAIAFAIVFSVKELCMCFNGSIVRFRGKFFEVGDRIRVGDIRGDVIETTLLSTTVQEVGKGGLNHLYTGKTVSFPNSLFLTTSVENETFLESFILLHLEIPVDVEMSNWKACKELLLKIAQEEVMPFLDQVKRKAMGLERRLGLEIPSVEPRVTLSMESENEIMLHLRMPSLIHHKERLEQVILSRYLEERSSLSLPAQAASPKPHSTV